MRTTRLVTDSMRAMARYRMRSSFIMLGSLIGVGALTLVICIGGAAERRIMTTMKQLFGESSILITARGTNFMGGPRANAARLTIDDVDAVVSQIPDVVVWDPQLVQSNASARRGEKATTVRVVGSSERWDRAWERGVTRGENFDASAVATSARVAIIGETVRRELFGESDPIDAEIQVGPVLFRVIGTLEQFGSDIHGMDRDNEIVIPISTIQRRVMNLDTIGSAKVLVRDAAQSEQVADDIRRLLRARHALAPDASDDFRLMTPLEVRRMVGSVQRILVVYLPIVAGIALLVGAIVASVLMLTSVNERVGEIGLRRAMGARPEDIRLQFLIETAITMLGGGLAGIALGYAVAQVAALHLHLGDVFSWKAIVLGVIVSIVTGLLAGLLPARSAARLNPIDALR